MSTVMIIIGSLLIIFVAWVFIFYRKMKNIPDVKNSDKINILNDKNFNQQVKSGLTLVDFWASWCVPCKIMAPVLNEIAEEYHEKVNVAKLDVDRFQPLAARYRVRNIPTMVLFRNGKEINRFIGVKSKDYLVKQFMTIK